MVSTMSIQHWEHFFKPDVRNAGRVFVAKDKVTISQPSDTEIQGYVRGSTAVKINYKSPSMASPIIIADCNCPLSKKGQFCKHLWAGLLMIENKKPDFLDSKTELKKAEPLTDATAKTSLQNNTQSSRHAAYESRQADFKARQATYRKEQYQKQKQRLKDQKTARKQAHTEPEKFPAAVEQALKYFSAQGFELRESFDQPSISSAMKKLARLFHPDVGGTHEEILELNRYFEVLMKFAKN